MKRLLRESTKTHCRPMVQSDSEDDLARCTGMLWEICLLFSCKAGPNTPVVRTTVLETGGMPCNFQGGH